MCGTTRQTLLIEMGPEKQGRKVRARLVVREIRKVTSEYEKLEPSDVFSAMPPVESLRRHWPAT